jgi:outer membrane protein assembly factor BamB
MNRHWVLAVVCLGLAPPAGWAEDWPRWRGPDLNGISKETGWTTQWPVEGPAVLWRAQVGLGYSSVVVSQGRLFTMGNQSDRDTIYCFNAETGKKEWEFSYPCATNPKYYQGGTSSTPTVDGDRVFILSRQGDFFCCKAADGAVLWSRQLTNEFKLQLSDWGFAGSPLVLGDRLILNAGRHGLALNKVDGHLLWKSGPEPSGYATPVPFHAFGRPAVLIFAAKFVAAVELKTGQVAWQFPWETEYDINAADPVIAGDQVFISSGYRKGGALLSVAQGKPTIVWTSQNMHNQLNASVLIDGHLYGISGQNGHGGELR